MSDEYEFKVSAEVWTGQAYEVSGCLVAPGEPIYAVELPHQCDSWTVTFTPDLDAAVRDLSVFVEEAQQALVRLYALRSEVAAG